MKILSITAGAAGMYCGSCLRDNALAAELIAQGHDVVLLPLYTPTLTDEQNVSAKHVFFGGISVFLHQKWPFLRKLPRVVDRLFDSDWALRMASKSSIQTAPAMLGELTVSTLDGSNGIHAGEIDKLVEWLRHEPLPDIINLPNTLLIALAEPLKRAFNRPVCCTIQGEDLFLEGLPEPYRTRSLDLVREQIRHVDAFLPVSRYYAGFMSEYLEIPASRMHVVPLGINLQGFESDLRMKSNGFAVGFFGRIAPEKGLHVLADAYRFLRKETEFCGASLEAAGYMAPEHRQYLSDIHKRLAEAGLGTEFRYHGVLDRNRKIDFYRSIDVFSLPATYEEPKGLPVLEAMATGVPCVLPRRGSLPEMVETAGGGLVTEPTAEGIALGIYQLWKDRGLLEQLGRKGHAGVRQHYSVQRMASRTAGVYAALTREEPVPALT
jgi:glycosyltransferase involved in cell wall biosynthesis